MKTLKENFQYFLDNQAALVQQYNGKVIVIHECAVYGVFSSELEAVENTKGKLAPGTFLIQKVTPGDQSYTQTFHSRVAFA
jgi:hypothetical protein